MVMLCDGEMTLWVGDDVMRRRRRRRSEEEEEEAEAAAAAGRSKKNKNPHGNVGKNRVVPQAPFGTCHLGMQSGTKRGQSVTVVHLRSGASETLRYMSSRNALRTTENREPL